MGENTTSSAKAVTVLFIGGAVHGAAAGDLFAPKWGKETRTAVKH